MSRVLEAAVCDWDAELRAVRTVQLSFGGAVDYVGHRGVFMGCFGSQGSPT
jgi:hypothetical protein